MKTKSKLFAGAILVICIVVGACKFSSTETADVAKDTINSPDSTIIKPDSTGATQGDSIPD